MAGLLKYLKGDRTIWFIMALFALASILVVFSSVGQIANRSTTETAASLIFRHIKYLGLGFVVMYIAHRFPYNYFSKISVVMLWGAVVLLAALLVLDVAINDASRWIKLFGKTFQVSDIAKVSLLMYVARVLSSKQDKRPQFRKDIVPLAIIVLVVCGLVFTQDLSTAILIFISVISLWIVGRVQWYNVVGMLLIVLIPSIIITKTILQADEDSRWWTWKSRVERFLGISEEGDYAQAKIAKYAIATAGPFGKAPGHSETRYALSHAYSDFIYAIAIEEYGLIGCVGFLLLYLILLYRVGVIVKHSKKYFGAFMAFGLAIALVFQALMHMAVSVGIAPVTGQPLPFISWGGTSIVFSSFAVGVILSVSRNELGTNTNEQTE